MKRFHYRFYDLELDYCPDHGYWLEPGEEKRVLELIKVEVKGLERKFSAEDKWASTLRSLHHPNFVEKLKDLFR
jgi:Zn-finger nucleic acid-binding protein